MELWRRTSCIFPVDQKFAPQLLSFTESSGTCNLLPLEDDGIVNLKNVYLEPACRGSNVIAEGQSGSSVEQPLAEITSDTECSYTFMIDPGYTVILRLSNGKWLAEVQDDRFSGFSRRYFATVGFEKGYSVKSLVSQSSFFQSRHIHFIDKDKVFIGSVGLKGGSFLNWFGLQSCTCAFCFEYERRCICRHTCRNVWCREHCATYCRCFSSHECAGTCQELGRCPRYYQCKKCLSTRYCNSCCGCYERERKEKMEREKRARQEAEAAARRAKEEKEKRELLEKWEQEQQQIKRQKEREEQERQDRKRKLQEQFEAEREQLRKEQEQLRREREQFEKDQALFKERQAIFSKLDNCLASMPIAEEETSDIVQSESITDKVISNQTEQLVCSTDLHCSATPAIELDVDSPYLLYANNYSNQEVVTDHHSNNLSLDNMDNSDEESSVDDFDFCELSSNDATSQEDLSSDSGSYHSVLSDFDTEVTPGLLHTRSFLESYTRNLSSEEQDGFYLAVGKFVQKKLSRVDEVLQQSVINFFTNEAWELYPYVVQHYSVSDWIVQCLLKDVVSGSDKDDPALDSFKTQWLEITKSSIYNQETLLKTLRLKKTVHNLSLLDIKNVLDLILESGESGYEIICGEAPRWLFDLKQAWLNPKLASLTNISASEQDVLNQVLADMDWGTSTLDEFLKSVQDETFEPVMELLMTIQYYQVPEALIRPTIMTAPSNRGKSKTKQWANTITHLGLLYKINVSPPVTQSIEQPLCNILKLCSAQLLEQIITDNLVSINTHSAEFVKVLELLYNYQVSEEIGEIALRRLSTVDPVKWVAEIDQTVSKMVFETSEVYPIDRLIQDVAASITLPNEKLKSDFDGIEKAYNSPSVLQGQNNLVMDSICKWEHSQVKIWAELIKSRSSVPQPELIAVVKRAAELHNGFSPRATQLVSLLTLLDTVEERGRLAQINTGEGKSLIVAMLATIHALQGKKVDVITTSAELSIPEVSKQRPFFESLSLTVAENSAKETKTAAYSCDVVYGTASEFQADILLTEFSGIDVRGNRGFNLVIVDEVDSMLFDNRSHSVRLSEQLPGMTHLELPLAAVWVRMKLIVELLSSMNQDPNVEKAFITENVQHYMNQLLRDLSAEEKAEYTEFKELNSKVIILEEEIANTTAAEEKEKKTAIWESLKEDLKIHPWSEHPVIDVPIHLRDFAKLQIPYWIENALLAAYAYKKDAHYSVQDNRIVPIHFNETGVLQPNMVWSDGLTQFLQLKEGLPLDPEGVSTNLISNVSFFKRYGNSILGVTGTLGEESTKEFLLQIYNTETVVIPPHERRMILDNEHSCYSCKELVPIVLFDEGKWKETIIDNALYHAKNERAVLLICKFICQVNEFDSRLREKLKNTTKVFSYTGESDFDKHKIDSGEIVIATNIAGRGTDFETSPSVEDHGGMYVAVTFLPTTSRVELQNVGRTARSGKKGMAQLIICDPVESDIKILKESRNKKEVLATKEAIKDAGKMLLQDHVFKEFCRLERQYVPTASVCDKMLKWVELITAWRRLKAEKLSPSKVAYHVDKEISKRKWQLFQFSFGSLSTMEVDRLTESDKQIYREKADCQAKSEYSKFEKQYQDKVLNDFCLSQSKLPEELITCLKEDRDYNPDSSDLASSDLAKEHNWGWFDRKGLEENWGFWLKGQHFEKREVSIKEAVMQFESEFATSVRNCAVTGELIRNPYYYVLKGNKHLHSTMHSPNDETLAAAITCYDKAIEMDPDFSVNALYNKALALLLHKENKGDRQKLALDALNKAKNIISTDCRPSLVAFSLLIAQYGAKVKTSAHAQHQLDLISQQENYIKEACSVIERAQSKGDNVKLTAKLVSQTLPPDGPDHSKAIEEAKVDGFTHLFKVEIVPPFPWGRIISLMLISIAQIIAGCLFTIYTMGGAGPMLIQEGVFDMFTTMKSAIHGRFDWAEWGVQKGISLAVSVASFGMAALKRGVKNVNGVCRELIGVPGATTVRDGIKSAVADVGLAFKKGAFNEMTSLAAELTANKVFFENWNKSIQKQTEECIIAALEENPLAKKALELDVANGNNCWQNSFITEGLSLINDETMLTNEMKAVCKFMVDQIHQGVGDYSKDQKYVAAADIIFKIISVVTRTKSAVHAVQNYNHKFMEKFNGRIESLRSDIESAAELRNVHSIANLVSSTTANETVSIIAPPMKPEEMVITPDESQEGGSSNVNPINPYYRPQGPSSSQTIADALKKQIADSISSSVMNEVVKPAINLGARKLTDRVFQGADEINANFKRKMIEEQLSRTNEELKVVEKKFTAVQWGQRKSKKEEKEDKSKLNAGSEEKEKVKLNKFTKRALKRLHNNEDVTTTDMTLACNVLDSPCEVYDERGNLCKELSKGSSGSTIKLRCTERNGKRYYEPLDPSIQITSTGENNGALDAMFAQICSSKRGELKLKDGMSLRKLMGKHICDDPELPNKAFELHDRLARIAPDEFSSGERGGLPAEIIKRLMMVDACIEASPNLKNFIFESFKLAKAAGLMKELKDAVKGSPYLLNGAMFLSSMTREFYDSLSAEGGIDTPAAKGKIVDYLRKNIDSEISWDEAQWAVNACVDVVRFFGELTPDCAINKLRRHNEAYKKPISSRKNLPEITAKKVETPAHQSNNEDFVTKLSTETAEALKTVGKFVNVEGAQKHVENFFGTLKTIFKD